MKKTVLLLTFLSMLISAFAQFSDTAQLNGFIRDTIKDRRPEKVSAAQIQRALLGLSSYTKPNAITKVGTGITREGDSIYLGGDFSGPLTFYGQENSRYYMTCQSPPDYLSSGNFLLENDKVRYYVAANPANQNEMWMDLYSTTFNTKTDGITNSMYLDADSFSISNFHSFGDNNKTKFRVSKDGAVSIPKYRNNISLDSVLSTDVNGNLVLKKNTSLTAGNGITIDAVNKINMGGTLASDVYVHLYETDAENDKLFYVGDNEEWNDYFFKAKNYFEFYHNLSSGELLDVEGNRGTLKIDGTSNQTSRFSVKQLGASQRGATINLIPGNGPNENGVSILSVEGTTLLEADYFQNRAGIKFNSDTAADFTYSVSRWNGNNDKELLLINKRSTTIDNDTINLNGKVKITNVVNPFQTLVYNDDANTQWNILNGTNAKVSYGGTWPTTILITNVSPGQEGNLLVTLTSTISGNVALPGYKLVDDGKADTAVVNNLTVIGKDSQGIAITGTWVCHFVYDGVAFYWNVKRASSF
jgi:hypothetical protein